MLQMALQLTLVRKAGSPGKLAMGMGGQDDEDCTWSLFGCPRMAACGDDLSVSGTSQSLQWKVRGGGGTTPPKERGLPFQQS